MSIHRFALPALLLASVISGTGGTAVKLALNYFGPYTVLFLRFFLATIVMLLVNLLSFRRLTFPVSKRVFLSSILFTTNVVLFTLGMQRTTAISAGILVSLVPINIAVLTHWRRKSEPVSPNQWLGLASGIIGTLIIIFRSFHTDSQTLSSVGTPLGNLLILTAIISYSLYQYLNQPLTRKVSPLLLTTHNFLFAGLFSLPLFAIETFRHPPTLNSFTPAALATLLFLSLILSVGMYLLYQWGIKHTSSLTAGTTIYLSPLVSAAVAIPILGERLTPHLLLGGTAVLIGVYLANRKSTVPR